MVETSTESLLHEVREDLHLNLTWLVTKEVCNSHFDEFDFIGFWGLCIYSNVFPQNLDLFIMFMSMEKQVDKQICTRFSFIPLLN